VLLFFVVVVVIYNGTITGLGAANHVERSDFGVVNR
jgi:hypothetical protein